MEKSFDLLKKIPHRLNPIVNKNLKKMELMQKKNQTMRKKSNKSKMFNMRHKLKPNNNDHFIDSNALINTLNSTSSDNS